MMMIDGTKMIDRWMTKLIDEYNVKSCMITSASSITSSYLLDNVLSFIPPPPPPLIPLLLFLLPLTLLLLLLLA